MFFSKICFLKFSISKSKTNKNSFYFIFYNIKRIKLICKKCITWSLYWNQKIWRCISKNSVPFLQKRYWVNGRKVSREMAFTASFHLFNAYVPSLIIFISFIGLLLPTRFVLLGVGWGGWDFSDPKCLCPFWT